MLAQVDSLIGKRMDELMTRLSGMMDKKMQKMSAEIIRSNESVNCACASNKPVSKSEHEDDDNSNDDEDDDDDDGDETITSDDLPYVAALSLTPDPFPELCSPLSHSIPVFDYLNRYPSETRKDRKIAAKQVTRIANEHFGWITTDVLSRMITKGACPRHTMGELMDLSIRCSDEDFQQRCKHDIIEYCDVESDLEISHVDKERAGLIAISEIAAEIRLTHIPLLPRDAAGLDAELEIRRRLLIDFYHDPYHIFDYLEHVRLGLMDSPLPPLLKLRRMNNLLPPAWMEWYSRYDDRYLNIIKQCFRDPIPEYVTDPYAQNIVEHVIQNLTGFFDYKDQSLVRDEIFKPKSWATLRNSEEGAYLIWQHKPKKPFGSTRRKVTREDLAKKGCLTREQMDRIYEETSMINPRGFHEFLQVCHPYIDHNRERIANETDINRLASSGMQSMLNGLGIDQMKALLELALQAASQTPFRPDHGSFSRLSAILRIVDVEYVDDDVDDYFK